MPAEVNMPVHVRVGDTEACWGTVTAGLVDGVLNEAVLRREMASFFRAAADALESPTQVEEEVPDAPADR